jgi:hypothetical protein
VELWDMGGERPSADGKHPMTQAGLRLVSGELGEASPGRGGSGGQQQARGLRCGRDGGGLWSGARGSFGDPVSWPRLDRLGAGSSTAHLDWFRAKGQLSSGVVERFNAKANPRPERPTVFGPTRGSKSRFIKVLAPYPNQSLPTAFPDEARAVAH